MKTKTGFYRTITKPSKEIAFKEKNSKFFGQVFPISSEEEVKSILESLQRKHSGANHICYAWQLGTEQIKYRANDDGEPNNSAGMPIYGQIKSMGLTNVLVTVTRFFGGTKLGVGGLISAYRTAAKMALDTCKPVKKSVEVNYEIVFPYSEMNLVMRAIKQYGAKINVQEMEIDCKLVVAVAKSNAGKFLKIFAASQKISIKKLDQ